MVWTGIGATTDYVYLTATGEIVAAGNDALTSYLAMSGGIGKEDGDCYFKTGDGATTGVGVKASGNTSAGYYSCTVVGLAASVEALFRKIAVGAFVCTTGDVGRVVFLDATN